MGQAQLTQLSCIVHCEGSKAQNCANKEQLGRCSQHHMRSPRCGIKSASHAGLLLVFEVAVQPHVLVLAATHELSATCSSAEFRARLVALAESSKGLGTVVQILVVLADAVHRPSHVRLLSFLSCLLQCAESTSIWCLGFVIDLRVRTSNIVGMQSTCASMPLCIEFLRHSRWHL